MSKNFWKLRAFTNFLKPIKALLNRNCNFGSNLKICYFGPTMYIYRLLTITLKQSPIKNGGLHDLKGDTSKQKMKPTRS